MILRPDIDAWKQPGSARLYRGEKLGLAFVALVLVAFGVMVELRGAFQNTRKTDLNCYTRAAYAVLTGGDIYQATDNNGYHYTYPPAFAVLMVPLADAPMGVDHPGLVPHATSVAIWTLLSFLLLARIVHVLAGLMLPDAVRGSRRWWYARTVPVYATFATVGMGISMGQVNLLVTALVVEMFRSSEHGQRVRSGLWLGAAIVLKVIPAFGLLYFAMKRDLRAGAGVLLALMIGLAVIPAVGLGVDGAITATTTFANRILFPGAAGPTDPNGLKELLLLHANDSHSFLTVIHCNIHTNPHAVPRTADKTTRNAHLAIAATLTLALFVTGWRNGLKTRADRLMALGLTLQLMVHVNPMSHPHYYTFMLPVVAAIWLRALAAEPGRACPSWGRAWLVAVWGLAMSLPILPGELASQFRHRGFMLGVSMLVWGLGLRTLAVKPRAASISVSQPIRHAA